MLKWFTLGYGALSGCMLAGTAAVLKRGKRPAPKTPPTIAVCVAARNEEDNLPNLIEALKAQDYPADRVQFWLIDDDSEDRTFEIATEAAEQDNRFHAIRTDPDRDIPSPKKRALDTAIHQARAQWIVTTDADCTPSPGWLTALAAFMEPNIGAVVGYGPLTGGENLIEKLLEGESWSATALSAAAIGLGFPFNAMGRNFAYRRKIYLDMGGFGAGGRMASGDDDLFLQRLAARTDWKVAFAFDRNAATPSRAPRSNVAFQTKARHMSAGVKYAKGWWAIGAIGSALYLGLGLASILALLGLADKRAVWKAWKRKWLFDSMMFLGGSRALGDMTRGLIALATMTVAPFALWIIWPWALFGNFEWKGRRFVRGRA